MTTRKETESETKTMRVYLFVFFVTYLFYWDTSIQVTLKKKQNKTKLQK